MEPKPSFETGKTQAAKKKWMQPDLILLGIGDVNGGGPFDDFYEAGHNGPLYYIKNATKITNAPKKYRINCKIASIVFDFNV